MPYLRQQPGERPLTANKDLDALQAAGYRYAATAVRPAGLRASIVRLAVTKGKTTVEFYGETVDEAAAKARAALAPK